MTEEKKTESTMAKNMTDKLMQTVREEFVGWVSEQTEDGFVFTLAGGRRFAIEVKVV
jgi:hypothetical protein